MNVIQTKDATIGGIPDDESLSDIISEISFYLPSFIKTLYIAGTNYGNTTQSGITISPSLTEITPKLKPDRIVHSPSRDLYYNMFRYLCTTDANGEPIFTAGKVTSTYDYFALPTFPKKGYFMEGALMLALYVIRLQLLKDTDIPSDLKPSGFIRSNKILYKKLKKQYGDFSETGSITTTQLEGLINPDLNKSEYIKNQLQDIYTQKSLSNNAYFNKLNNIQTSIQQTISDTVRKKAFKYLKALGWAQENPDYHFISIGDGSDTFGILNMLHAGLMLFEYDYQNTRDVGGMATGRYIYPKYLNQQSLSLVNKNFIHLNLFGTDQDVGSAVLERSINGFTSRYLLITQGGTSNPLKLISKGNLVNDTNLKEILYPITGFTDDYWRDTNNADEINPCINKLIGKWESTTNDMTLYDNEGEFSVYLRGSYTKKIGPEELFLIVCACKEDLEVTIELEHIYDEDRFELSNTQRLATIDNDNIKKAFIDFMVSQIRNDKCEVEIQMLKGGFVGKLITPTPLPNLPKVESDIDYLFDLTAPNESPIGNQAENSGPGNSALLYSFGKIVFKKAENINSKNKFIISIESYCSAEWSRLDRRLHFDIRNYGHTLTINGNSAAPVISGSTGMDAYTIFGQNSNTDAKIHSGPPEGSGLSIDIASYNHLLTQLRSMGLLEAIFISATVLDKSRTCVVDPNKVQAFLIDVLSNISIPTYTQNQIPLTYADYLRFKWYDIVTTGSTSTPPWLPVPNGAGGYDIAPGSNPTDFKSLTDL